MKCQKKQTTLFEVSCPVNELPFGEVAKHGALILTRVKPVNFLCNSTIINDMISKGNCLVVNLQKGTCFVMNGDTTVVRVDSTLAWNEL